jgi:tetratricopeptide (TPR) repeat protein
VVRGAKRPVAAATKAPTKSVRKKPRPVLSTGSERRKARGPGPKAVREEFLRLGGPRGTKFYEQLVRAAEALAADREKDALRLLRPLRAAMPASATVHEQMGIALYRSGRYDQAAEELESYIQLCGAVDQHPALMDCYRAARNYDRVSALWNEIGQTAAAPEVTTEGRIVLAGSLADRGRIKEAVATLARRGADVKHVQDHNLRLWYALADLEERAGNLPRARTLFERISRNDPSFADVMERLVSLG